MTLHNSSRVQVSATPAIPALSVHEAYNASTYTFDGLTLQHGSVLSPVTLAYETWGTLNAEGDNAILITHALTGDAHAHDVEQPDSPKVAWWNPLIGPGQVIRYITLLHYLLEYPG